MFIQSDVPRQFWHSRRAMKGILMNGLRMGLLSAIIGSSTATVVQASEPHQFKLDIPRESLSAALADFARETGLQVARFSDDGEPALAGNSIVGVYTAEQALDLILAGTGYTYRFVNARTIAIVRIAVSTPPAPQSPPVENALPGSAVAPPGSLTQSSKQSAKKSGLLSRLSALFLALSAGSVGAQTADAPQDTGQIQELVVTAQRRGERLQDVPISVDAFGAAQLEAAGVSSTADLPIVTPGLIFGQQAGYAQPFLRGVGTVAVGPGVENPVALYVDNVYYGSVPGSVTSLNNIEQIEVDKGPQGTLFGRNATGGLIQITTKVPSRIFGGSISATYGNYDTSGTDFYLTGGMTSALAADLAVHFQDQGQGFGRNLFNGQVVSKTQDLAARNKWVLTTLDGTQLKLILDYEQSHFIPNYGPAPGTTALGAPAYPVPPQDIAGIFQPYGSLKGGGVSFHIKHDFGFAEFASITAYRSTNIDVEAAASLSIDPAFGVSIAVYERHNQITQEFQLSSLPTSRVKWSAGAYLYDADAGYTPAAAITGGLIAPLTYINLYAHEKSYSAALYGQATTEVAPDTNLTLGIRYTAERRDFRGNEALGFPDGTSEVFPDAQHKIFDKPTWRFALDHHFTPDVMAYLSYNRGFKSGGYNDLLVPTVAYAPETLDAYEIGSKVNLFDHHLSVDGAGFFYNYKNMQEIQYFENSTAYIYNGAAGRLYGLDLDAKLRMFESLSLSAGLEFTHSYFTSFHTAAISTPVAGGGTSYSTGSVDGNKLPFTPNLTLTLTADYVISLLDRGDLTLTTTYSYNDGFYGEPDNRLHQPSYNLVNALIAWSSPQQLWKIRAWGRNLTDKAYTTALGSQPNGDFAVFAPPRTYGVTIQRNFL
jgi:iron complex outermembrane receptor protein